jgi:hypothetical protein
MNLERENVKLYLNYLDKEMTIMGILSSFCMVTLGVIAGKILFPDTPLPIYRFWDNDFLCCLFGFIGLLTGSLAFYRQRSLLALYYGQISLNLAKSDDEGVKAYLDYADGWDTWIWYRVGFGALTLAFGELGIMLLISRIKTLQVHASLFAVGVLLLVLIIFSTRIISYSMFHEKDQYFIELLKWLKKKLF